MTVPGAVLASLLLFIGRETAHNGQARLEDACREHAYKMKELESRIKAKVRDLAYRLMEYREKDKERDHAYRLKYRDKDWDRELKREPALRGVTIN